MKKIFLPVLFIALIASACNKGVEKPKNDTPSVQSQADWKTYVNTKYGFEFKYPDYIAVDPATRVDNPKSTSLDFYQFNFTPQLGDRIPFFNAYLEVYAAENFVLDSVYEFVTYNPSTGKWYVNSNASDRPTVDSRTYKNLYKSGNEFNPPVIYKTTSGMEVYGPLSYGDAGGWSSQFLILIKDKNIIINFGRGEYQAEPDMNPDEVNKIYEQFNKDFSEIIKSFKVK